MQKVLGILGIIVRIFAIIVLLFASLFSLATAYIMFAPDSFPKPFYLQYAYPTIAPVVTESVEEDAAAEVVATEEPMAKVMFDTGSKIINLSDPSGNKYIRITVVLEFAVNPEEYLTTGGEEEATDYTTAFTTEITEQQPVIDDVIITLLSTKTYDDLYTAEGKETLRNEIREKVSASLSEYHLTSVYFTEFIVD